MDNLSALGMVAVMVVAMEVDKVADTLVFFNFFPLHIALVFLFL